MPAGCPGSSVQAVIGYPLDVQVHEDSAVRPLNMYGVSKCFAEAVAHYFAATEGLSCIVIRVGTFDYDVKGEKSTARHMSTYVSRRDMVHLLVQCIETPHVKFAIAHGVSNNRFKFLDISSTREVLGYYPQDDAFQIAGTGLRYIEQFNDISGSMITGRGKKSYQGQDEQEDE